MSAKKNFVLDTNVILHDYKCLFNFQDNDIFIPIVVLEELDKFKKGNDQINFNAREFVRELDEITDNHLFTEGALLGPDLGRLSIVVNSTYPEKVKSVFPEKKPDHLILAATLIVRENHPDRKTILVTKDINLRMKARAIGIETEDYINDKVKNIDIFESEHRVLDNVSPEIIDAIYKSKDGIPATEISNDPFKSNECFVLESGTSSVLARYVSETDKVRKVIKEKNFGIEPRNAEQTFAFDLLNDPEVKLLALTGKAGTGKTLLALAGALLVGVAEAKAIAFAKNKPLVGVHHIEGHISANYVENKELEPPFVALVVSGGHTHLVKVNDYGEYEIVGRTRDDAAGEAFDKVARAIGLGYPGGPKIDKLAKEGNPDAIEFPRAHVDDAPYDFSFSGIKSAVLNYINSANMQGKEINRADVAASFQKAVVDALVSRAVRLAKECGMDKLAIAGGVASNSALRAAIQEACAKNNIGFYSPSPILCTDNAAMIGAAAYYEYIKGVRHGYDLNAVPNLKLGERI